jgi:hypothetical protein
MSDITALINLERYPVTALDSPQGQEMLAAVRHDLERDGACSMPQFLSPEGIAILVEEAESLAHLGFAGPTQVSPYFFNYDIAGADAAPDHPSRHQGRRNLKQVAYDLIPKESALARLYHSDVLTRLVAAVRGKERLYRLADRYQSMNISVMEEGGCQQWHFDRGRMVTTLLLQSPQDGGVFEYVPHIRSDEHEHFDEVAKVLAGDRTRVRQISIKPGMLNLFQGHYSIHRVTPVVGDTRRVQSVFAFADEPDRHGSLKSSVLHYGPRVAEAENQANGHSR